MIARNAYASVKLLAAGMLLALLPNGPAARAEEAAAPALLLYPADVQVPADPVAKAAFDVLEKHCSRCHQAGMLVDRQKPARNFGNVLRLDELAANPHYIQPGNPEASKIFQQILNQEMPYDLYNVSDDPLEDLQSDKPKPPEMQGADIEALRAWIKLTGDAEAQACSGRTFVSESDIVDAIAGDLQKQPDERVRNMRYLTLTNLYNSCAPDAEMTVFRQGVVKLLNSLGRRSDVVRLATVDAAQTVVAFNLQDLGWSEADWNTVLARYAYATRPDSRMFDVVAEQTGTVLPYVRADWFAFSASQPPLYDALLRLPESFPELARALDVDLQGNIDSFVAKRAGFQKSGVSQNNRLIERHPISTGYFWTSYDFSGSKGRQSLFLHPLGPGGETGFHHDGGESLFSLPNGFQAYYLNRSDGARLDKGPTQIVRDVSRRDLSVTNGISCMGCHNLGMRKAKDEVRNAVTRDRSFPKSVRDTVASLYPETAAMDAVIEDDAKRFDNAMRRAGLDPNLQLSGVEMVNALYKRYEDDLSLRRAAAEYGFDPERFKDSFREAGPEASALMRRLEQGIVPRDQFEQLFAKFVETVSEDTLIDVGGFQDAVHLAAPVTATEAGNTFNLQLTADKSEYRRGDTAVFAVKANRGCSLFVVNVSPEGAGTVIFPNRFQSDNAVQAGQSVVLGGADSPFKFRLKDAGREKVVAVCRVNGPTREIFGVAINTADQVFAEIPDFDRAMTRSIAVEANDAAASTQSAEAQLARIEQAGGARPEGHGAEAAQDGAENAASTAIILRVR